jgi:serine/threonine-protein kinase
MSPDDRPANLSAALGDRYVIERALGSGGMATVYLADDVKHRRKVAIKVLRAELASSIGPQRFLREIEIAASLNHPHILPLYDSGAAGDVLYYVMPYVRGETLRQRLLREKQLSIDEALDITRQVAAALAFAHAQGVIHRDIKPENILLHEGEAIVADFGIALVTMTEHPTVSRLTETGTFIGTPEYMSPEQAQGQPGLDARSDVYSLACVMFEMLAGEAPHSGPTPMAVLAKRFSGATPSLARLRSAVPVAVDRALTRALASKPADRFESVAAFASALSESAAPSGLPSVAVLPFVNLSSDPENEYFADGITEDVIAQLSRIRALKVISRTSVMPFKGRTESLREIGAALGATTILEGSVRRVGDRVRIVAQLIDVESDQHLWAETYDRQVTDIFAIQSDVALHIAGALQAELSRDERTRISKEPTTNVDAYQLYLHGRHCYLRYNEEGFRKSIEYYNRAIERDGGYAMAHVGLALAYAELGETGGAEPEEAYGRARAAARRAIELDNQLSEAHCVLGYVRFVSDFDWAGAELEFKRALELSPGNTDANDLYGRLCAALGRYDEAIAFQKRANELDPIINRVDLATAYLRAGRYEDALDAATRAVDLDPHDPRCHATLGWAFAKMGDYGRGLTELQAAVALSPNDSTWLAQLGQATAMAGNMDAARELLRKLDDLSRRRFVSPYHFAYVHTGLGEHDRAMDYLEKAYEARSGAIYGVKGSFLFTSLHPHPRFRELMRKMNLL